MDIQVVGNRGAFYLKLYRNDKKIIKNLIYYFFDMSEEGYKQLSYLRRVDEQHRIYCGLVIGK